MDTLKASTSGLDWSIEIGPNTFGNHGVVLNLHDDKNIGENSVTLTDSTPYPATLVLPDIMGWFAWLPGMQCRHGVVSMNAKTNGALTIDGEVVDFNDGSGS